MVTVPKAGKSTNTVSFSTRSGASSDSSSRSVSHAAATPGNRTRAVTGRPLVSRSRTVTVSPPASAPVRPAASGFPRGLSAPSVTVAGSTDSPPAQPMPGPVPGPGTVSRSWL